MSPAAVGVIVAHSLASGSAVIAFVRLRRYRIPGLPCLRFGLLSLGAQFLLSIQLHLSSPIRSGSAFASPTIAWEVSIVQLEILNAAGWACLVAGLVQLLRARSTPTADQGGDLSARPARPGASLRTAGSCSLAVCGVLTLIGAWNLGAWPTLVQLLLAGGIGISLACRLLPSAGLGRALAAYWIVLLLLWPGGMLVLWLLRIRL